MGNTDSPKPPTETTPSRRSNRKLLGRGLLVVALVVLGAYIAVNVLHIGQKVYAEAAGHKVYHGEIKDLIGDDKGITDHQAATVLADKYLTEKMAKEHGVTLTSQDITKAYGVSFEQSKEQHPYAYQNLVNQLYFTKLNANNQGLYKGKLLVANFSHNVPYQSPLLAENKAANPNLGNSVAIAADKKYAQDFITDLYNQIQAKKISFDQAIEAEHNNPVVGEHAYPTQSHSGPFNAGISQINLLGPQSIRAKVTSIKPGETTKPFVVRVPNSAYDKKSTAESYFLVVHLDSKSGGNSSMNWPQELEQAKKQLGYKVYV